MFQAFEVIPPVQSYPALRLKVVAGNELYSSLFSKCSILITAYPKELNFCIILSYWNYEYYVFINLQFFLYSLIF